MVFLQFPRPAVLYNMFQSLTNATRTSLTLSPILKDNLANGRTWSRQEEQHILYIQTQQVLMSCDPFDVAVSYSSLLPLELVLSAHHTKANSVRKTRTQLPGRTCHLDLFICLHCCYTLSAFFLFTLLFP